MTHREDAQSTLARWREVERLLAAAPQGSDEAADLQAEAAELREALLATMEDVVAHGEPKSSRDSTDRR